MPSFTFVSTANAVVAARRDARCSSTSAPTRSTSTSARSRRRSRRGRGRSCPSHYAGVGCEMDAILRGRRATRPRSSSRTPRRAARPLPGPAARAHRRRSARSASTRRRTSSAARAARCSSTTPALRRAGRDHPREGHEPAASSSAGRSTSTPGSTSARSYPLSDMNAAFLWAQLEAREEIHAAAAARSGTRTTRRSRGSRQRSAAPAGRPGRVRAQRAHLLPAARRRRRPRRGSSRASTSAASTRSSTTCRSTPPPPDGASAAAGALDGDRLGERTARQAAALDRHDGGRRHARRRSGARRSRGRRVGATCRRSA